jgi:hypothetical protein
MGYCTDSQGRLCCDICGDSGNARRQRCPHGYCPAIICCQSPECKAKLKQHRKEVCSTRCKEGHRRFVAVEADRVAKLIAGAYLRCSALNEAGYRDCVKVWFRNRDGQEQIRYMATDTYRAVGSCLEVEGNATPDDFARYGEVSEQPREFAAACLVA